jgi:hypothetical protein
MIKRRAMQRISNQKLRQHFMGWQCRIRQISAREYGGQPLAAMRPRVSTKKGEVILPAMNLLIVPVAPAESTAYFRFQVQKNWEHQRARDAGIKFMAAEYFQLPELFSEEMTAVFGAASDVAARLLKTKEVLLDFEQFSQSFRMFCKVRRLRDGAEARESSLWQSRLFNPNVPADADVLGFTPDWKTAQADPMPQ